MRSVDRWIIDTAFLRGRNNSQIKSQASLASAESIRQSLMDSHSEHISSTPAGGNSASGKIGFEITGQLSLKILL